MHYDTYRTWRMVGSVRLAGQNSAGAQETGGVALEHDASTHHPTFSQQTRLHRFGQSQVLERVRHSC